MVFWITAAALALAIALVFALTLLRAKPAEEHPAAYDLRIYRDQLKEVERDLARGLIDEADAERVRTEVGRRVLQADARLRAASTTGSGQPRAATLALAGLVLVATVGGSLALYPVLGKPGARDLPISQRIARSNEMRATRPSQAERMDELPAAPLNTPDEERFADLIEKLREAVAERPDDLQGQTLLARNEAGLGNYSAAAEAQAAVVRLRGDEASADDHVLLADLMITAAQGYVSPEAEAELRRALEKEPNNPVARYYTGQMLLQNDRPDMAFRLWDGLLRQGPENAPWIAQIRRQIDDIAWMAGVRDYSQPDPAGPEGPSAESIANAEDLSEDERRDLIQNMVDELNDKLATEGGSPEEWARLIGALGILGNTDHASAIWDEAQMIFADQPQMLATVREGAVRAGLLKTAPAARELPLPGEEGAAPAGPTAEDMENAAQMPEEDREEMIRTMVATLSERLAEEGGSAQEWARLITSQAILGDREAAESAFDSALAAHGDDRTARATIETAARSAGLVE
ncbi:MAG: cytochrome c-type biogenesis protein CcmH [Rhodobacteraceae bacterium HLUCCO07]|nr:MAG: cytochrome c-type biogenesis protein CcmH [Rhodobacteraceae bacterium HLUCCO07]